MAKIDRTITIDAPRDTVWALIGDPLRWPEWQPAVERAVSEGPGAYRLHGGGKRPFSYEIGISGIEPQSRIEYRYGHAVGGRGSYTLAVAGDGTEVRMQESLKLTIPPPASWVVDRLFFNRSYNKAARVALEELKRVAEGRPEDGG